MRVLIADSSAAVREALTLILECLDQGIQVVGLAQNGREATAQARELRPDVIIIDAQMPGLGGLEATRQIKSCLPETKILALSVFIEHLEAALAAGADGGLCKDCDPESLIAELRRISR